MLHRFSCKPRPVPYALCENLEKEIERLRSAGIMEAVSSSTEATPVVPIPKSSGNLRICGHYKITVNSHLVADRFPIPRVSDILEKLDKGILYSKLNLAQAYQQIELDDESKELTTISTHKGLFRYNYRELKERLYILTMCLLLGKRVKNAIEI